MFQRLTQLNESNIIYYVLLLLIYESVLLRPFSLLPFLLYSLLNCFYIFETFK